MRVVPALKDIGLFGPAVQDGLKKMGVLGFQDIDDDALLAMDEQAAEVMARKELEVRRQAGRQSAGPATQAEDPAGEGGAQAADAAGLSTPESRG